MTRLRALGCLALSLPIALAALGHGRAERLPADGGVINVRDHGARGNGQTDDTAAILDAIAASGGDTGRSFWHDRIVYFPDGIYKVSDTLLKRYPNGGFGSGLMLVGQSQSGTIIRLADGAPGFSDPAKPKAVVFTSSKLLDGTPRSGGKDYAALGEGNDAYMNFVEDMTIDVGHANPDAIGIDYLANNLGAIRDVTVKAPPQSGSTGIAILRKWPGPALLQRVHVEGFETGIDVGQTEYGLTLEAIQLSGQRVTGLRNAHNALAVRNLVVDGPGQAIANTTPDGFIALDGVVLRGAGNGQAGRAISNAGTVTVHGLRLDGGLRWPAGGEGPGPLQGTLVGNAQWSPLPTDGQALSAVDAPAPAREPVERWANVTRFGAQPDSDHDSTEALRRAFASGARTVYLPGGTYAISDAIDVPSTVRRIIGMNASLTILQQRQPGFARTGGMLRVASAGDPVSIERLAFDNTGKGQQLAIEVTAPAHGAARDVIIRDVVSAGVTLLDRKPDGGRVFLEDVCCGRMQIAGPRGVFARQLNTEGAGTRILNVGAPLWILGLKTEGICTVVDNRQGARTEIMGGLVYMVREGNGDVPLFRNDESWISASLVEESLRPNSHYRVYVAGAGTQDVLATDFPPRGLGRIVPVLRAGHLPQPGVAD